MKGKLFTSTLLLASLGGLNNADAQDKKNVLFIIVDDLRPELNCYGASHMHTPNIDKMASDGTLFTQSYCNIPVSGASRASLLTGLRPTQERWWDVHASIDTETPEAVTLPKYFKENGYTTVSNSKVMHDKKEARDSWSKLWMPKGKSATWRDYLGDENLGVEKQRNGPEAFECLEVEDSEYFDGKTAEKTIKDLRKFKKTGKPFFLAVGILKPHLPFNAPKKYWDLYDANEIEVPSTFNFDREGFPNQAFHTWGEIRYYKDIPQKDDISEEYAKKLIHGYRASVSYADAQIGLIMDELKRLELDKNTVVVLIGDHGWSLGDHNQWCKHSNFAIVNHTPLIFIMPEHKESKKISEIVEFVDLYPTICEAAGLPIPENLDGKSMVKLMSNGDSNWKDYAIVKWHWGVTLITQDYKYTEWRNKQDKFVANMLFDTHADPVEQTNIAPNPKNKELVEKLSKELVDKRGKDFFINVNQPKQKKR